jgi:hypothetical protein
VQIRAPTLDETAQDIADNSATTKEEALEQLSYRPGIIDSLGGWYPLAGLGATVVVSKELIYFDGDNFYAVEFGILMAGIWIALGGDVHALLSETRKEMKASDLVVEDLAVDIAKDKLETAKASAYLYEGMKYVCDHVDRSTSEFVKYQNLKYKHGVTQEALALLESTRNRIRSEEASKRGQAAVALLAKLAVKLKEPSFQKASIDYAIDRLAGKPSRHPLIPIIQELTGKKPTAAASTPSAANTAKPAAAPQQKPQPKKK